ncbi:hypothetical protein [Bacillus haynesii]|uniref:hypothetical protein n=1 Tax=Bacillus haynesii TaxID=1925021 RepID=UPI00227FBE62|nr:hypothetical protein [Bacillus haynesii]MCY7859937.1 hypothetical protein [Bacillus haynesii]MCY8075515.1 hypothetical protein [Bacillus haynesii]MCY8344952.1 hypothetical protein [Bacillus haynesii]MCY8755308.1 hypothetical protein [Bacillus haynesii]MCY9216256.1 hypothetical protein [Bacillus haynesii]
MLSCRTFVPMIRYNVEKERLDLDENVGIEKMRLCSHVQRFSDCKAVRCMSTKCRLLISG